MTNLEAAERMLKAMADLGRLEPVDEARVVALRSLARAVDAEPGNASLWREYRAAEASLRKADDPDFDYAGFLEQLSADSGDRKDSEP